MVVTDFADVVYVREIKPIEVMSKPVGVQIKRTSYLDITSLFGRAP